MRLVSLNVQYGKNEDGHLVDLASAGVADLDADVVAIAELDHRQPRSQWHNQLADLADGLGWDRRGCAMHAFFSGQAQGLRLPAWTSPQMPRTSLGRALKTIIDADQPAIGGFGVALLTKHPVRAWRRARLGSSLPRLRRSAAGGLCGSGYGVYWGQNRGLLAAAIDYQGTCVRVGVTHLELGTEVAAAQLRYAWESLNGGARGPVILAGDMNLPASTVQRVTGVPPARDATAATFPKREPRAEIDHVLVNDGCQIKSVDTAALKVGDHRALIVELQVGP